MFEVLNRITGKVIGTYKSRKRAVKSRDIADCKYGAYVHMIKEIPNI